jgi:G:T-mismatch repair DNA endonuclease (very short patch repair protein)
MSRIRGKDTTPERIVRSLLHRMEGAISRKFPFGLNMNRKQLACATAT